MWSGHITCDTMSALLVSAIASSVNTMPMHITGDGEIRGSIEKMYSSVTDGFPSQRTNNAEDVPIWWRCSCWYHCTHGNHGEPLPPPLKSIIWRQVNVASIIPENILSVCVCIFGIKIWIRIIFLLHSIRYITDYLFIWCRFLNISLWIFCL